MEALHQTWDKWLAEENIQNCQNQSNKELLKYTWFYKPVRIDNATGQLEYEIHLVFF